MKSETAILKQKLIDFQVRIAELSRDLKQTRETFQEREKNLLRQLLKLVDAFENIEETLAAKESKFDKSGRMLAKNIRSIHGKFKRLLADQGIEPMDFPDHLARIDACKIVDTRSELEMKNETILSIVKNGYIDKRDGSILRKAEVITVLNET